MPANQMQFWIIALAIISTTSLYFRLRKYIKPEYKKISLWDFLGGIWIFIYIAFMYISPQYILLNSTLKYVISLLIFGSVGLIIYRFEQKYKREIINSKKVK